MVGCLTVAARCAQSVLFLVCGGDWSCVALQKVMFENVVKWEATPVTRRWIKPVEDSYSKLAEFEFVPSDEELAKKARMRSAMEKFHDTLAQADIFTNKEKKK